MKPVLLAAALLASSAGGSAFAQPSEDEIARNFDRWAAALASKDPATVTALFAPNAILEPTVSNEVRTTPARARELLSLADMVKNMGQRYPMWLNLHG